MHTITICPRCGQDFMYHNTDYYLERDITQVDEIGNNEVKTIIICQDCDEHEKEIEKDFPVKDDIWASRRWNEDRTDYIDL